LLAIGVIAALVVGWQIVAYAGPVGDAARFEDDDGNLAPAAPINFDWNSFAPVTWTGTAPNRVAAKTQAGWDFDGLEDAQATTSDSAFAGGTKQDNSCPRVITAKAPNKDDLKRVYFANKQDPVTGDIFLELAWVRITQNTTSPSAHVAFEFNQSDAPCGSQSDGLVQRTAGDMLIVYDFEGGATDTPTLRLSRWVTSGACEVGSNTAPCWGPAVNLTQGGFAEGRVNTSTVGPVLDQVADPDENLQLNEFGEAGINLTDAGVFDNTTGCVSFGKAYAVSRTSGSSSTAQMKDLVGPGDVNINNCGGIIIRKETVPSPDPTDNTFDYSTTGGLTPATFDLKNGESQEYGAEVQAGPYSVTETDANQNNFALTAIDCSASDNTNGSTTDPDLATGTVDIVLEPGDTVDCTFVNSLQTGAIKIIKDRKHAADGPGDHPHAGVDFTVDGQTVTTDANGEACVDGLDLNNTYTVHEETPAGYAANPDQDILVDNTATCEETPYGGETANFHNTPLTNLTVSVDSQVDGGTASTINCGGETASTDANGDGELTLSDLEPNDPDGLTCTIVIDP
jgi:hypothetical protein